MVTSWIEQARQFKSPLAVVAGFFLRSRETQAERAKSRTQELQQIKKLLDQQSRTIRELREQLAEKNSQIARIQLENRHLGNQPTMLPDDPPLPHHEFGPKMISLCVNLARRIGLLPVPDVLKMIFDWLEVEAKLPDWTTVRTWMLRVGVAAIKQPIEQADDWIVMADHSNQIGPEKVLAILGVRASKLPLPGQPLKHDDVRVLELTPGTSWKREDMAEAYEQLAQRCGVPLAVHSFRASLGTMGSLTTHQLAVSDRMISACTISRAMYGNGVGILCASTCPKVFLSTPLVQFPAKQEQCGEVRMRMRHSTNESRDTPRCQEITAT